MNTRKAPVRSDFHQRIDFSHIRRKIFYHLVEQHLNRFDIPVMVLVKICSVVMELKIHQKLYSIVGKSFEHIALRIDQRIKTSVCF